MSKLEPQTLAEACMEALWRNDKACQALGMVVEQVGPGSSSVSMTITEAMSNGHGNCHGGYIFTLADSSFAYACNSYNQNTVAHQCSITYITPAQCGDTLTANAREVSRTGRNGIYDISIDNQDGTRVAEFRGHSRTIKGSVLPDY